MNSSNEAFYVPTVHVDDLVGLHGPAGFNVLYKLLLALYTVPMMSEGKTIQQFMQEFESSDDVVKSEKITQALCVTELMEDEILVLAGFAKDENGIKYCKENLKSCSHLQILAICRAVLMAFASCRLFF